MSALERLAQEEFKALMARARKSLERTGGELTGSIGIPSPSDAERKAIGGLIGRHPPRGVKRIEIKLTELDEALRTKTGSGLVEVLQALGPELLNRPEARQANLRAKTELLAVAQASFLYGGAEWFRTWVETLRRDGTFTSLIKEPARFAQAVRVLEHINGNMILLPTLAGRATGHTHALDHPGSLSGLVLSALASRRGIGKPRGAEERRDLWDHFNVIVDDLASRVLVLNLAAGGAGLGEWLTGAASYGTPFHVTLHQLVTHPLYLNHPIVYVCENPAVLREVAEKLGPESPPLICTEGRPSTAFHRLAHKITKSGGELRYHGDFDWPGVDMATAMIARHDAVPWRLTAADYLQAVNRDTPQVMLEGTQRPTSWDPDLGREMARVGKPIFEEVVADLLLADLQRDDTRSHRTQSLDRR